QYKIPIILFSRQLIHFVTLTYGILTFIGQNFAIPTFSVRFILYIGQIFTIPTFSVRFILYIGQSFMISTFSVRFTLYIRQNSAIHPIYRKTSHDSLDKLHQKLHPTPNTMLPSKKYLLPTKETGNVKFHLFIYKHV